MIQYVCLEGVLMICSSHSLSGCIYYVHSTKLAGQLVKPGPYLHYIPLISASRLGTRHKKDNNGMNTQHKKIHIFSLQSLVYIS